MSSCPVCNSPQAGKVLARACLVARQDHDLTECPGCGVVRFDPLPTNDELEQFYSASYYDFPQSREEGHGRAFARRLKNIKAGGRLLDVGCATGFFIRGIKESSDWEVSGVEFGASAAKYARETLGLEVRNCSLEEAKYPGGYFDYIRINNVLEHVGDPLSLLWECRRIIAPGGRLSLAVPNGSNDSRELTDFFREEGVAPRSKNGHIYFFPARTLKMMFQKSGFEPVANKTGSIKRGLRNAGYLPRKKAWKKDYYPKEAGPKTASEVAVRTGRTYPGWYYRFRQLQGDLLRVPGLHDWGLDFLFLLRPVENHRT
jgi:2-polyprenyl-3-methyl-5-hydroxy-6-metoxy-1,4-benzoquinol methylase